MVISYSPKGLYSKDTQKWNKRYVLFTLHESTEEFDMDNSIGM